MDAPDPPDEAQALALEGLLRWYAAMGVDSPVDETPHDRFSPPTAATSAATPRRAPVAAAVTTDRPPPALDAPRPADALAAEAAALAAGAADLGELQARWAAVPGCTLAAASRMIPAAVPAGARVLMIGGAPGEDDERAGTIFAGAPGRLLDAMLAAVGLTREAVGLAHVVPWRPPGNRAPTPLELSLCLPFCRRLIALAEPKLIVCLGERATQPLLDTRETLPKLRGRWMTYEGEGFTLKCLTSFAPAALLLQPLHKRHAWSDLQVLEAELAR